MFTFVSDREKTAYRLFPAVLGLGLLNVSQGADFNYTTNADNTITITSYTGVGGNVTIPTTINGFLVTGIGGQAFNSCRGQTSVTIPNSVTSIGDWAFGGCNGLTSVIIGSGVTNMGGAFYKCVGLTNINVDANNQFYISVDGVLFDKAQTTLIQYPAVRTAGSYTIPNSVTSIGDWAFEGCSGLTSVAIPNSVTNIGDYAFDSFSGLTSVTIPNSVTKMGDWAFGGCNSLTSVTIGSGVITIGQGAFQSCASLTSVTIPNSVTSIEYLAFSWCTNLRDVTIPNSVSSIRDSAFVGCTSLISVTIPNNVTIGDYAFSLCSGLTSVTIPNSVIIGDYAFSQCSGLASLTIGSGGVTSIGDKAFAWCGLTSVTIPNSVVSIGEHAFDGCSNINVDASNRLYSSRDGVLFNKAQTMLLEYPLAKVVTSYTLPESVTSIWESAFEGCTNLTSVTIPNNVTSIGDQAFAWCGLRSVSIPNSVTSIGEGAFIQCYSLTSVTIGRGVTSIREDAFGWCTNLTSVTIPNNVTSIGDFAFDACSGLTKICFQGNAPVADSTVFVYSPLATAYYLPGTTGWDAFATNAGIPVALWTLPYPLILQGSIGVESNQFSFTVSWATNLSVVVEASPSLSGGTWTPLVTNTLSGGSFYFADPLWTNYPSRFYGVRSQ